MSELRERGENRRRKVVHLTLPLASLLSFVTPTDGNATFFLSLPCKKDDCVLLRGRKKIFSIL